MRQLRTIARYKFNKCDNYNKLFIGAINCVTTIRYKTIILWDLLSLNKLCVCELRMAIVT